MSLEIFNYKNSNPVSISNGMINATEMAKAFEKRPSDYLKTKSAKEYLLFLNQAPSINYALHVVNGGSHQGTWMCYELALDFAKWLSLDYHHWINLKLKELLKTGQTQLSNEEQDSNRSKAFIKALEEQIKIEREKEALQLRKD
jgi:hypothetical protein